MDMLEKEKNFPVGARQEHRVAMLLHDIGHYPMSHATEKAVEKYYKNKVVTESQNKVSIEGNAYLDHERVGGELLTGDKEVKDILESANLDPKRVGRIFGGKELSQLQNLVKSELDADRLDYLMRSSQATGLPYGNYDRDYIIQNLTFDGEGQICLNPKALRAADHFLLCRTFDYLQTIFHKSVVGLEQMLQHCVIAALEMGLLHLSDEDVRVALKGKDWLEWDDAWLLGKLRQLETDGDEKARSMASRLRLRQPPQCLWLHERLVGPSESRHKDAIKDFLTNDVESDDLLSRCTITWFKSFCPTDVSPSRHVQFGDKDEPEKVRELIRIKEGKGSKPLIQCPNSLMKLLGERQYIFGRVYFVGQQQHFDKAMARMAAIANDCNRDEDLRHLVQS